MVYEIPPILEAPDEDRDVLNEVGDALIGPFGFTHFLKGQFTYQVDSEHSAYVELSPWEGRRRNFASIRFGIARRDVNVLRKQLLQLELSEKFATITDREPYFFGMRSPRFEYIFHTPDVIQQWLDEMIPRLKDEASNFNFLSVKMDQYSRHAEPSTRRSVHIPRFMTALLDGWSDDAEEEFLAPMVAQLDEDWRDDPDGLIRQGRIDRVRAWIAEHPDGVERQLTD